MAPCALLAAFIGLGFGSLSANGIYGIPSLSPALSSISILAAVTVHVLIVSKLDFTPTQQAVAGGLSLAVGSTCGALLQWGMQVIAQRRAGLGGLRVSWANPFKETGIYEVLAVMVPAALNSGLTQVATFTDLYFASFIPGAAAALGYANLLVMAPLGILSPVLLSLLPIFSLLSGGEQRPALRDCVQQGLLLAMALTLSLTAVMIPLARPTVEFAFQRRTFDASASSMVSSLLVCYVSGAAFFLSLHCHACAP
jgi:putative peptidoglycan lipid II flippase